MNIERDVLLRLPVDGLGELRFRHDRQADFLNDHGITGERRRDVFGFEGLALKDAANRGRHRPAVDDGAIDNAVGRDRFDRDRSHLETLAVWPKFDGLDGARADVEPDDRFRFVQSKHVFANR